MKGLNIQASATLMHLKMATSSSGILKAKAKAPVNKADLRKLMREKQVQLKTNERKIESPFAKYNKLGQLICVLCNVPVKNELLWDAHIYSKSHKQKSEELKKSKQASTSSEFQRPKTPPPSLKRKAPTRKDPTGGHDNKIIAVIADNTAFLSNSKSNTNSIPSDFFDEPSHHTGDKPSSSTSVTRYSSDDDDDEDNDTNEENHQVLIPAASTSSQIHKDMDTDEVGLQLHNNKKQTIVKTNTVESLPEGFFDDPVVDAKVRKVEYKDPIEEEWERFQKEITEATAKSQALMDEEEEESKAERQIDEIDEQIQNWARVNTLLQRKEALAIHQRASAAENDEQMDADEQEFNEFLDWRSKGAWR